MKRCLHALMGCFLASLGSQILADGDGSTAAEGQLPTPRIVNGEDLSIAAAPSSVALISESVYRRTGSLRNSQFCGATLITERWLLTAAHCLVLANGFTREVSSLLALAGTTDLDNPVTDPIAIDSLVIHPNFRSVESGFDIALLRLAAPTNSTFSGIDTDPVSFNEAALIVGWGTLKSQEEGEQAMLSPVLQGATVFMVPGSVCDSTFPEQRRQTGVAIDNRQICAAVPGGGTDTCQGDSGGALYRMSAGGELGLVGVVSYGVGCGLDGYPGVYTNVGAADNRSFVVTTVNDNPTVTTSTQVVAPDDDVEDPEVDLDDVLPPFPGAGAPLLLLPMIGLAVWLRRKTKRMTVR